MLMATALLYLTTAVQKDTKPLAFLGFPFIYNGLFVMGFYNYALSIGLMLISIGYWWRNVQDSKRELWDRMRSLFGDFAFKSMRMLYEALFYGIKFQPPIILYDGE